MLAGIRAEVRDALIQRRTLAAHVGRAHRHSLSQQRSNVELLGVRDLREHLLHAVVIVAVARRGGRGNRDKGRVVEQPRIIEPQRFGDFAGDLSNRSQLVRPLGCAALTDRLLKV